MKDFIAFSNSSKELLNIARLSASLPVNILIVGERGVGKKLLANTILQDSIIFEAYELEYSLSHKSINIDDLQSVILLNIEKVVNKKEFISKVSHLRIVATSQNISEELDNLFAVKMEILPLNQREEDLEELIKIYYDEAKEVYDINFDIDLKDIKIDVSNNGISLKSSIYKYMLLQSLTDDDIINSLEIFIVKKLKDNKSYKELLEYFEKPLLLASKSVHKSQLQMAKKLKINRTTLRNKLEQYSLN